MHANMSCSVILRRIWCCLQQALSDKSPSFVLCIHKTQYTVAQLNIIKKDNKHLFFGKVDGKKKINLVIHVK